MVPLPILHLRFKHARAVLAGDYPKARSIEGQIIMSALSDAVTATQNATAGLQTALSNAQSTIDTLKADSADAVNAVAALGTVTETLTGMTSTLNALSTPAVEQAPIA